MSTQIRLAATGAIATGAASVSLHAVFAGNSWVVPVFGAVLLVVGTTTLAREARLPSVLRPLAAALVVLVWITWLDARHRAYAGVVPGPGALRQLRTVTRNGVDDIHLLATPVPTHRGVVLIAVVGVAAVALVVDLLVVELRRSALAGIPLLAVFATCAGVTSHGAGIVSFVVAAAGFLWLLFVDSRERVTRWGGGAPAGPPRLRRSVWSGEAADPAPGATATALGRRIGAAAIGLGVVVPFLIPGLHTGIDRHGSGGSGQGSGDIVTVDPIVSIASDLTETTARPVLSYRTTAAEPGYLRLTSLDSFNGSTFSASPLEASAKARVDGAVPGAATTAAATGSGAPVTTTVDVLPALSVHWLPVDTQPTAVTVNGDWRYDPGTGTIFSATSSTSGQRYTVTSDPVDPSAAELVAAGTPTQALADNPTLVADLSLPHSLSPEVRHLTATITANAGSAYAKAVAIQRYFVTGNRFHYDTSIPADDGPDALADFLLHTRRGFCQQFATAMTVMARISGIPARVAVGFTRGTQQANGSWLVTTHDAHAWPELWFQGIGWVPFEPTPRGDGQAIAPAYTQPATHPAKNPPTAPPTPKGKATPATGRPGHQLGQQQAGGAGSASAGGGGSGHGSWSPWLIALLVLGVGAVLPGGARVTIRWWRRRRMTRPDAAVGAAWAELRASALDLHLGWESHRSPRQTAAALALSLPRGTSANQALTRVAMAEERSRYAREPGPGAASLWSDVEAVVAALREGLRPMQSWRYRLLPRSVLISVAGAGTSVVAGFGGWWGRVRARPGGAATGPRAAG